MLVQMPGGKATWGESTGSAGGSGAGAGTGAGAGRAAPTHDYRDYRCTTWHLEPTVRYTVFFDNVLHCLYAYKYLPIQHS